MLEVKHGPVQRRRWNEVSRWNYRGGRFWNDRERPRLRTPQYDEAIMHEMVRVRGRVPRVFFEWFKHQTETDWKARKMLRQCLFEER